MSPLDRPQKMRLRKKWDDSPCVFPTNLTNHGVPVLILAAAQHHPPVLSYLPTRRKRQCMGPRWVRVAEVWRVSLITDDGGDGRRVYSGLIFVSAFYMASSPLRPKIVILQEIVIIIISFFCVTYCPMLSPNSAGYGAPWWPWNGGSRHHRGLLVSFSSSLMRTIWAASIRLRTTGVAASGMVRSYGPGLAGRANAAALT